MPYQHARSSHSSRKTSQRIACLVAVITIIWIGSGLFSDNSSKPSEHHTEKEIVIPLVRTLLSEAQVRTREIILYGTTENIRKVTLKAETAGKIARLDSTEGEFVKEGDVIATLEMDDRQARLKKAQATVTQRRLEHKVAKGLLATGHQSETKLAEAYAQLQAADAELLAIQLDIEHTKVRSPFTGLVQETFVEVGDLVRAREDTIATVIDYSTFLVVGYVPEQKIATITPGSIAFAKLVTGMKTEGIVRYISHVADPVTRTFRVEIEIPSTGTPVSEGITSEIRIPTNTIDAHLISSSYFSLNNTGDVGVKTLEPDGRVKFHPITILDDGPEGVWVSGLPARAQIITVGQAFLQDGDRARTSTGEQ